MGVLIVAGVSGSGKTTVGQRVAELCDASFLDSDTLHPAANVAKMRSGHPLTDEDRRPWLEAIRSHITTSIAARERSVIAASCLERIHRHALLVDPTFIRIAFLNVSMSTVLDRPSHRHHEFFPSSLVPSQFQALELPANEPGVVIVDGELPVGEAVAAVVRFFRDFERTLVSAPNEPSVPE
jgi:gluconokinase